LANVRRLLATPVPVQIRTVHCASSICSGLFETEREARIESSWLVGDAALFFELRCMPELGVRDDEPAGTFTVAVHGHDATRMLNHVSRCVIVPPRARLGGRLRANTGSRPLFGKSIA
jgi:hypothetical protein